MSFYTKAVVGFVLLMVTAVSGLLALAPPHPRMATPIPGYEITRLERSDHRASVRNPEAPNNILVLRVDFADLSFIQSPQFPDSLAHDDAFFDRWMMHLADFYADASKGNYLLQYTLWPDVFTMPQTMAYYGADSAEMIDARMAEMLVDLVEMADPEIDFSAYGGIILFHAGAGQETDIGPERPETLWSTFVTRKKLQNSLDPENDDYPGIPTQDGIHIKNVVLVPEYEWHDYFPQPPDPSAEAYIFSLYGVLAHQFGHLLGLPTLFDNDSSNGQSQGVGNWCLMGTGVWNANGYVPAQLSAWNRAYMGWDTPVLVTEDSQDLVVEYFLSPFPQHPTIYKIPISDTEYFLIENRQQNPDGSLDPYTGAPSFSFPLLPPGEQDYYLYYPERPYFNFMENRFKGCEWDFMLPGLGGPLRPGESSLVDGSGILIWHIDENIMNEYFDPDFEINRPNGNALHKAVDLEEADGLQHMDTALFDYYMNGGPYDSYRADNNSYLGQPLVDGLLSLPTAESYYGGVPLEIHDVSASGHQMSFSVRFDWRLATLYEGSNPYGAAWIDLDNDGNNELFYPMPSGELYAWANENLIDGYPVRIDSLANHYTYLQDKIYFPTQVGNLARLRSLEDGDTGTGFNKLGYYWAAQAVETPDYIIAPLQPEGNYPTELYLWDKADQSLELAYTINSHSVSNPAVYDNKVYILSKAFDFHNLHTYDLETGGFSIKNLFIPPDSTIVAISVGKQTAGDDFLSLIVQCSHSVYLYHLGLGEDSLEHSLADGFPFVHDEAVSAGHTMADLDNNASLDIVLTYNNGLMILDRSGALMGKTQLADTSESPLSSSALVVDVDNDGQKDILACLSLNRLACWDAKLRPKSELSQSFPQQGVTKPIIGPDSGGVSYVWLASNNGTVFRKALPNFDPNTVMPSWSAEYANLARTSHFDATGLQNEYDSTDIFVEGELYFYPNPLRPLFGDDIKLSVMPTSDCRIELNIYDISGALIYKQTADAKAYLKNREVFEIPAGSWSSGVYIAVVRAGGQSQRLRFAIQK